MSKKRRKGIRIALIVVGSLCLCYFGGGYVAGLCVQNALFGKRLSNAEEARSFSSLLYYSRNDYETLKSRKEITFQSGGNELRGYFYEASEAKGTFVFAHGINGYADDATAMVQDAILRRGYSVFAVDLTASGRSQGEGLSSLAQGAYDIKAALEYLFTQTAFYAPLSSLFLAGYSWGAYSVAASLNFSYQSKVSGVLCFSGFDSPEGEMLGVARNYAGFFADMNSLTFDWALATRCGEDRHLSASKGILSSGAKAYIVHGDEDSTVSLSVSIYQALEGGEKVKKNLKKGYGHTRPWLSESSAEISKTLQNRANQMNLDEFESSLSQEEKTSANLIDESLIDEALSFLAK